MNKQQFDKFLTEAVNIGASDIHFKVGEVPALRKNGKIIKTVREPVSDSEMIQLLQIMAPINLQNTVLTALDLDFAYQIENVSRFRVNVSRNLGALSCAIRLIPFAILTFKELNLPDIVGKFAELNSGLVLVTGTAGSGKSTSIASILEYINTHYDKHIITIEDPVEYVYKSKKSIINQRQIGLDTDSFADALKYVLRQDPDVILIGEIRDRETIISALKAAETGHLVFATVHTIDAVQTVNRILSFFEPHDRENIRSQFAQVHF